MAAHKGAPVTTLGAGDGRLGRVFPPRSGQDRSQPRPQRTAPSARKQPTRWQRHGGRVATG